MIGALDPVPIPVPLNNTIINWDEIVGKEVPGTDVAPNQRSIG